MAKQVYEKDFPDEKGPKKKQYTITWYDANNDFHGRKVITAKSAEDAKAYARKKTPKGGRYEIR